MDFNIRKVILLKEEIFHENGPIQSKPRERGAAIAIVSNPYAGGYHEDLQSGMENLKELGCDYICASSGGISGNTRLELGEGYQVDFADKIRREAEIPTMAVGMIYDPHHSESIVADGQADMVALARGLLFDPHWPVRAAAALDVEASSPPQYERAYGFRFLREKEKSWLRPMASAAE